MSVATHLIKIKGSIDTEKWTGETLKKYVKKKITDEVEPSFHTSLELFRLKDNDIEVWVYVSALPSEVKEDIVKEWMDNHIKEDGITTNDFEIINVANFLNSDKKNFFVILR